MAWSAKPPEPEKRDEGKLAPASTALVVMPLAGLFSLGLFSLGFYFHNEAGLGAIAAFTMGTLAASLAIAAGLSALVVKDD